MVRTKRRFCQYLSRYLGFFKKNQISVYPYGVTLAEITKYKEIKHNMFLLKIKTISLGKLMKIISEGVDRDTIRRNSKTYELKIKQINKNDFFFIIS